MRTSSRTLNKSLKDNINYLLAQTLADLKSRQEVEVFISDFLTEGERDLFAKRLAVAYWLKKGRSYTNIKDNLKVSSATIASIQGLLSRRGVQNALKKIEAEEWANQWSEKIKRFVGK